MNKYTLDALQRAVDAEIEGAVAPWREEARIKQVRIEELEEIICKKKLPSFEKWLKKETWGANMKKSVWMGFREGAWRVWKVKEKSDD